MNKNKLCNLILIFILIHFSCNNSTAIKDKNEIDPGIYVCSMMDPDMEELIFRGIELQRENDHPNAIRLFQDILSIRPNCFDVYSHLSFSYAVLNDMKEFHKAHRRSEELKFQYYSIKPGYFAEPKKSESKDFPKPKSFDQKPSPGDKINYWKWLYIYSLTKNRSK